MIKHTFTILFLCIGLLGFSQEKDQALLQSNNLVYEGNELIAENEFVSAEMEYRKAISKKPSNAIASYDLGNAYYKGGKFNEALLRHTEAAESATTKEQKYRAWHNIGNTLMQNKKCPEAVEAFKNALRNNPSDDETRYNLGIAKECAEQQKKEDDKKNEDKSDDKKNEKDKEKKDGENENEKDEGDKEEKDNKGDKDKEKEGDDKKDEKGDPKDEKDDKKDGKPKDNKEQKKPQQGQLSPQQIKNLLEAMNNQEQKVQEKINAKKTKGVRVKTDKDW